MELNEVFEGVRDGLVLGTEKRTMQRAPYVVNEQGAVVLCPNRCTTLLHYHGLPEGSESSHRGAHCPDISPGYLLSRAEPHEAEFIHKLHQRLISRGPYRRIPAALKLEVDRVLGQVMPAIERR